MRTYKSTIGKVGGKPCVMTETEVKFIGLIEKPWRKLSELDPQQLLDVLSVQEWNAKQTLVGELWDGLTEERYHQKKRTDRIRKASRRDRTTDRQ